MFAIKISSLLVHLQIVLTTDHHSFQVNSFRLILSRSFYHVQKLCSFQTFGNDEIMLLKLPFQLFFYCSLSLQFWKDFAKETLFFLFVISSNIFKTYLLASEQ